jgi:propionate CoA-transferase
MARVLTPTQAAELIQDGDTVATNGNASILVADCVLKAIEERFQATGHPRDLTVIEPCNAGMKKGTGIERLAHVGLLRRVVASAFPVWDQPRLGRMLVAGDIEGYNLPMGVIYQMLREAGGGRPGVLTKVGLGTFVDPRQGGGRINARTSEELVRLLTIDGDEYLFIPSPCIQVAVIRGTTADESGNIAMEREPLPLGILALATAARNSGGKVIAQVERLATRQSLPPKGVVVPGCLVDAVVVVPDQEQSAEPSFNPYITGEARRPLGRPSYPPGPEKGLLRRAILELRGGDLVNLGVGLPADIPGLLLELNAEDAVTFSTEHGAVGGIPAPMPIFGAHVNPTAILDAPAVFDLYNGGGLDISFLGLAQVDEQGNVNVSKFGGILPGCGGFIDITSRTRRLVFCGMFSAGGPELEVAQGRIRVVREGRVRKFVRQVDQVTLNGQQALERGQDITVVTERCVLRLRPTGWELTEVAPGVDVDRDLLPAMEFTIKPGQACTEFPPHVWDMTADGDRQFAMRFHERLRGSGEG